MRNLLLLISYIVIGSGWGSQALGAPQERRLPSLPSPLKREGNGGERGGGTAVRLQPGSAPILLDLLVVDPRFTDRADLATQLKLAIPSAPTPVKPMTWPIARRVNERFAAWKGVATGDLVDRLRATLHELPFLWGPGSAILEGDDILSGSERLDREGLYLPSFLVGASLRRVAHFTYRFGMQAGGRSPEVGDQEVILDGPEWQQFGDTSQAGTLIHEALRVLLQRHCHEMDPRVLETFVGNFMLTEPSPARWREISRTLCGSLLRATGNMRPWPREIGTVPREDGRS